MRIPYILSEGLSCGAPVGWGRAAAAACPLDREGVSPRYDVSTSHSKDLMEMNDPQGKAEGSVQCICAILFSHAGVAAVAA